MKRLILASAVLTASFASAGNINDIPMPPSLKGDASGGLSAYVGICDFVNAKVLSAKSVSDSDFVRGMAVAFAMKDKIKPAELAEYVAAFVQSYQKAVDDDKAAPDGIIRDH